MEASVKWFRGAIDVAIKIDGVAIVSGLNGAGKSSVLQAVGAAVANAPIPFFDSAKPNSALLAKKDAKVLVFDGEDFGGVRVATDDGAIQLGWPSLDVATEGAHPEISRVAAGIVTPLGMPDADRAAFFAGLLQTTPTSDELRAALTAKDVGLKPAAGEGEDEQNDQAAIDEIVSKAEVGTYDGAYDYVKTNGAKLKGRWEEVAGERFGVSKTDIKPKGWTDELDELSPETITEELADARQARDGFTAQAAVDEAQLEALLQNAQKEQTAHALYADAQHKAVQASKAKQAAQEAMEKAGPPKLVACAHCGGMNKVTIHKNGAVMVEQSDLTEERYKALQTIFQKAGYEFDMADQVSAGALQAEANAGAQWRQYKGSKAKYDESAARSGVSDDTERQAAIDGVKKLELALELVTAKRRADLYHARILLHNKIIEVLAPTGLRQKKLLAALDEFNSLLAGICEGAEFEPVVLQDNLTVTYGARPYFLVSDSQKWRCRAAVQLATAIKEAAQLVIIDGVDILAPAAREPFLQSLIAISRPEADSGMGINVLLGITLGKPEHMPPLGKMKDGNSYWLESGKVAMSA